MIKYSNTVDVCTAYLQQKRLKSLKASSISNYFYKINAHIIPKLPDKFHKIKEADVFNLVKSIKESVSNSTLASYITLINDIFQFAHEKKYIRKKIIIQYPQKSKNKINVFTEQEQRIIEDYLLRNLNYFNFGILIALRTGIRLGELGALRVKDIDSEKLHVNLTLQRVKNFDDTTSKTKVVLTTPKSQTSIREIPFDNLYSYLQQFKYESENSFIITGTDKYIVNRTIERRFKKILTACSIPEKKFHVLRDTFATNYARAGIDIKVLSELLGHSNTNTTWQYYVYVDFEIKKESMKRLPPLQLLPTY